MEAEYPDGQRGWNRYLVTHLKYPDDAANKGIQGTVVVEFIVRTNGKVSDVIAISGPEALREESIRVLMESGRWTPAMNHGVKVDSYKKQPFNYVLEVK